MTHSRDPREALRQARAGFEPSDAEVERVGMALEGQLATLAGLEALGSATTAKASAGSAAATGAGGAGAAATGGAAAWIAGGAVGLGLVVAAWAYVAVPSSLAPQPVERPTPVGSSIVEGAEVEPAASFARATASQGTATPAVELAEPATPPPAKFEAPAEPNALRDSAASTEASARPAARPVAPRRSVGGSAPAGRRGARTAARTSARASSSAEPVAVPPEPPAAREASQASATVLDSPVDDGRLSLELRMIERASAALRAGDATRAMSILHSHERAYPDGSLRVEREALLALASCAAGDASAARSRAQQFLRAHPASPLVSRVQRALQCEE